MRKQLLRRSIVRYVRLLVRENQLPEKRAFTSRRMAKIINIKDADQVQLDQALEKAVSVLSSGGVVATPTDTIYGIAASVNSAEGIQRLYAIKGRREQKPIAICLSEVEDIRSWTKCSLNSDLLHDLLPGPVTAVLERGAGLNSRLNPGNPLVGVRIPAHSFTRRLVAACGHPLALTSANISNTTSTLAVEEFQELWPHLDLVIDGGRIAAGEGQEEEGPESRSGSTVVNLSQPGKFTVIRKGSSYQQTLAVLRDKHSLTEVVN